MAKKAINFRIDEELAARVDALRVEDETTTAVYSRLITAGVEHFEGHVGVDSELIRALNRHIEQLTAELESKNEQLSAALTITAREQELRLLESRTEQPADDDGTVVIEDDGDDVPATEEKPSESRVRRWFKGLF